MPLAQRKGHLCNYCTADKSARYTYINFNIFHPVPVAVKAAPVQDAASYYLYQL